VSLTYFQERLTQGFIVDPSMLSAPEGFDLIFYLKKSYVPRNIVMPTILYNAAKEKDYDKIAAIIKKWQWRLSAERIRKWVTSPQFSESMQILIESSSPASKFWKLERDPPTVSEIAQEIREISVKLGLPIIARSKSFYRWLRKEGVSIFELVDKRYKAFKTEFRRKYKDSLKSRLKARGIEASLDVFIGVVAFIGQTMVPPPWNLLLPSITLAGGKIIDKIYVAVVIDPRIWVKPFP
jgi:hypothetical protein